MSTSTLNGLVLITLDYTCFYYCVVKDGKFNDGHVDLRTALLNNYDWTPALGWKIKSLATPNLIVWDKS